MPFRKCDRIRFSDEAEKYIPSIKNRMGIVVTNPKNTERVCVLVDGNRKPSYFHSSYLELVGRPKGLHLLRRGQWTEKELNILKQFPRNPNAAWNALAFMSYDRTLDAIYWRMRKLGIA